jgi:predicted Zn-dependent protease
MPRRPTVQSPDQPNRRPEDYSRSAQAAGPDRQWFFRNRCLVWLLVTLGVTFSLLVGLWIIWATVDSPASLVNRAEAASRTGNWVLALNYWRSVNATEAARSATHLGEAQACLKLSRAAQAERSLRKAITADATSAEPWRLLLEILRVEDRIVEEQRLGWDGYEQVRANERQALLRELTLGLLVELPDELVRSTLHRWIDADKTDLDAQVALVQRIATQPRANDPNRPLLMATTEAILAEHPDHIGAREALVSAYADSGEPDRGRTVLDAWPGSSRDARYWRLRGRWLLEYDHRPDEAVMALQTALAELPQDWRSWYRLARVYHILGRFPESTRAAESTSRIREVLDPLTLAPRLANAFDHLDKPEAYTELAAICDRAGLTRLAAAWRAQADLVRHDENQK